MANVRIKHVHTCSSISRRSASSTERFLTLTASALWSSPAPLRSSASISRSCLVSSESCPVPTRRRHHSSAWLEALASLALSCSRSRRQLTHVRTHKEQDTPPHLQPYRISTSAPSRHRRPPKSHSTLGNQTPRCAELNGPKRPCCPARSDGLAPACSADCQKLEAQPCPASHRGLRALYQLLGGAVRGRGLLVSRHCYRRRHRGQDARACRDGRGPRTLARVAIGLGLQAEESGQRPFLGQRPRSARRSRIHARPRRRSRAGAIASRSRITPH